MARTRRIPFRTKLRLVTTTILVPVLLVLWRRRDQRVRDAAGEWRTVIARLPDADSKALFRAVYARLTPGRPQYWTPRQAALFVLVPVAGGLLWAAAVDPKSAPRVLLWAATAGGIALVGVSEGRVFPRRFRSHQIRDAWLAERHCPTCAYPLAEHTHRPDHLHCPECGATWSIPPLPTSA